VNRLEVLGEIVGVGITDPFADFTDTICRTAEQHRRNPHAAFDQIRNGWNTKAAPEFDAKMGGRQTCPGGQGRQIEGLVITAVQDFPGACQPFGNRRPPCAIPALSRFTDQIDERVANDDRIRLEHARKFLVQVEEMFFHAGRIGKPQGVIWSDARVSQRLCHLRAAAMDPRMHPTLGEVSINLGSFWIPEHHRSRR